MMTLGPRKLPRSLRATMLPRLCFMVRLMIKRFRRISSAWKRIGRVNHSSAQPAAPLENSVFHLRCGAHDYWSGKRIMWK